MPFHIPSEADALSRVGALQVDPGVVSAIRTASTESGTRFDTLMASAAMESGLNPSAKSATSSASGLFQFTEQTWLGAVRENGAAHGMATEAAAVVRRNGQLTVEDPVMRQKILALRQDPQTAASLAGDHLRDIADKLSATTGHAPDATELYLGHFLGSAGAAQMLAAVQASPNRSAAALMPEAAQANRGMFYAGNGTPLTVSQFMDKLRGRVERAYTAIGSAMPTGPLAFDGTTTSTGKADPTGAGSTGWGSGTPVRAATSPERLMLATLTDVFTRLDRGNSNSNDRRQHELPAGILTALEAP